MMIGREEHEENMATCWDERVCGRYVDEIKSIEEASDELSEASIFISVIHSPASSWHEPSVEDRRG